MTEATASSNQIIGGDAESSSNSASGVSTPDVATSKSPSYSGTKHKIDFDGHEIELDYDVLVNEFKNNAKKAYQLEQDFKRLSPLQQFYESLQKGDLKALRDVVPRDMLRQFSEQELLEYIEEQNMDPREREFRDRERNLKEWEDYRKNQEEQENQRRWQAECQRANEEVQKDLAEAVKDLVGDSKVTPRFLRRVAERLYANMENGRQLPGSQAAKMEWDGLANDYKEYQQTMLRKDPKAFVASLPPELIKAIRDHELSAARPLRAVDHTKEEQGYVPEKRLGVDETFKAMDRYYEKKRKQQNRG